jgi:hypothetical protein
MLEIIFTIGQAASALLIAYGGFLVLMPARKPASAAEERFLLLKQLPGDV